MLRIFIISSHLMFSLGLENLLRQDKELRVLGQETNREQAIRRVTELQPEVVIVYTDDTQADSRSFIIEILKASPTAKVIGLSLQNNTFCVYQIKQGETRSVDDLFKVIKGINGQDSRAPEISRVSQSWSQ
jgi:DNA-binding NarL/FixJ family response regulator